MFAFERYFARILIYIFSPIVAVASLCFICFTRPSLSFDGRRREMGRGRRRGGEEGQESLVIVPRIFGLRAFEQLGLSRRSSESS